MPLVGGICQAWGRLTHYEEFLKLFFKTNPLLSMFEYTFDPITQELEVVINLCKLEANLLYRVQASQNYVERIFSTMIINQCPTYMI